MPYSGGDFKDEVLTFSGMIAGPLPEDGKQCVDLANSEISQNFNVLTQGDYQVSWYDNTAIP
jgi:hypothetical protein